MRKLILIMALNLPLFAQSSGAITSAETPVISMTRNGTLYVNEKPTNINNLAASVRQFGVAKVVLRADMAVPWDAVAQVLAALSAAKEQTRVTLIGKGRSETEILILPNAGSIRIKR